MMRDLYDRVVKQGRRLSNDGKIFVTGASAECRRDSTSFWEEPEEEVKAEKHYEKQRPPPPRVTLKQWAYYRFDLWIAKRQSQLKSLVIGAMLHVLIGGILLSLEPLLTHGDLHGSWTNLQGVRGEYSRFWRAWRTLVDPGSSNAFVGCWDRLVGVLLAINGVLYMSTVLGLVVDVIQEKLNQLKVGKTVREIGHVVILGWSDHAPLIISELILANQSEGGGVVVILAEEPAKDAIEAEITLRFRKLHGTRVVVRHGSPMLCYDLNKVSVSTAKCTIALSETTGDADRSDALSLRKVLTLRALNEPLHGFVLVEIRDVDNEPLVKLVGGDAVETLCSHDIVGRMMVMSSRNPGLSRVYSEVLGFDGDEFYMRCFDELEGLYFSDLQSRFENAVPIGIASADETRITLKPSLKRRMKPGEKVIVLAEDDDTYEPGEAVSLEKQELPNVKEKAPKIEQILFCGWRRDVRDILLYLDELVAPGSCVHMCTDTIPMEKRNILLAEEGLNVSKLKNITIEHFHINTSARRRLEELPLEDYTSVMVFPDQAHEQDMMHSDSHAISTLLLIRDIQVRRKRELVEETTLKSPSVSMRISDGLDQWRRLVIGQRCPMICEILDPQTQATVESNGSIQGSSDFMQSNRLIAQVLAMIGENRGVKLLLNELLSPDGASFSVVHSREYVKREEILSFYQLSSRAMMGGQKREILIGYQNTSTLETVINPRDKDLKKAWDHVDLIMLKGVSRLDGQDRYKAEKVVQNMISCEGDRKAISNPSAEMIQMAGGSLPVAKINDRIAKARRVSAVNFATVNMKAGLTNVRTEDLVWLNHRLQDEIRNRELQLTAPLNLPIDPTLQKFIDGIQ